MPRAVPEWKGKSDDHRAPDKVRRRAYDRANGTCHLCKQPIEGKKWALDHVVALINGGENRESNLQPAHNKCHADKTAADVAEKAKVAAMRNAHLGIREPSKMQGKPFPPAPKSVKRQASASSKLSLAPKLLYARPSSTETSRHD